MTWYQTQQEQSQWKRMIQNPKLTIIQILDSQQFATQLIKQANPDIFAWVQKNHKYFFEQLLIRCLVLPKETDTTERKFKEPTKSIKLLCQILDGLASTMPNAAPAGSVAASIICPAYGERRQISHQIIIYIVQKMFGLYGQNEASQLLNTLIPGYFAQIFDCLNKSHTSVLTHVLRTTQQGRLQKLLDQQGQYQQILKCIQCVLVVFFAKKNDFSNLQGSVTFPNTPMVHPQPQYNNNTSQPNHPFQTKYRILMAILTKMKNFKKVCDPLILQNMAGVLIQIIRNVNGIFEGPTLVQYICQSQNAKIFLQIALCNYKIFVQQGLECQVKCIQLMKYCVHLMTPLDRTNLLPKFEQIIKVIISTRMPTLRTNSYLQLLNQWFLSQSSQLVITVGTSMNGSLRQSMNSNLSNSSSGAAKSAGISSEVQSLFTNNKLFQHLIRQSVTSANNNIYHQRVTNFIITVFKSQNHPIINSIFKENQIIKETILTTKNFKQNPYFGFFVAIIECYTTRRIDTPAVNESIEANKDIWNKFYMQILQPHVLQKFRQTLGEMNDVPQTIPIQFVTSKCEQQRKIDKNEVDNTKLHNITNSLIKDDKKPVNTQKRQGKQTKLSVNTEEEKLKQEQQEPIQQISLNFIKKQSQNNENTEQKQESESFQNFMKRKLGQTNTLVEQRKKSKSRTPSKMMTGQSKRKKWGADPQSLSPGPEIRKTISADQTAKQNINQEQAIGKIVLIKINKSKMPKYRKQRKISNQKDSRLMAWLQKSKRNIRNIR